VVQRAVNGVPMMRISDSIHDRLVASWKGQTPLVRHTRLWRQRRSIPGNRPLFSQVIAYSITLLGGLLTDHVSIAISRRRLRKRAPHRHHECLLSHSTPKQSVPFRELLEPARALSSNSKMRSRIWVVATRRAARGEWVPTSARSGFLEMVPGREEKGLSECIRLETWPPRAAFFEGPPIGIAYYVQRWFRYGLQEWINQRWPIASPDPDG